MKPNQTPGSSKRRRTAGLSEDLRTGIHEGRYAPGDKLPSTRDLARRHQISLNTVHAAIRQLEAQGLVHCKAGVGNYVAEISDTSKANFTRRQQVIFFRTLDKNSNQGDPDGWLERIMVNAEAVLAEHGLSLGFSGYEDTTSAETRMKQILEVQEDQLAGVILRSTPELLHVAQQLDRQGIPWVSLNRFDSAATCNFVTADNRFAGQLAAHYASQMDMHRILILSPKLYKLSTAERVEGFLHSAAQLNIPMCEIHVDSDLLPSELPASISQRFDRTIQNYITQFGPPQFIFAASDTFALTALRICRRMGFDVPNQISIMGATGLSISEYADPSLSVVAQPMVTMGKALGQLLIRRIQRDGQSVPGQVIPSNLELRGSTRITETVRQHLQQLQHRRTQRLTVGFGDKEPST